MGVTNPAPPAVPPPDTGADALKAAGDIIKVSTGLATGALVFSVGLLPNAAIYTPFIRACLVVSWALLLLSIVAGILSQSAVPVLLADQDYDIENKYYTYPGRAHQLLFGAGLAALAIGISVILYSEPGILHVSTASEATDIARRHVAAQYKITQVTKIELLKGPSDKPGDAIWHTQFEVLSQTTTPSWAAPTNQPSHLDIFVSARDGSVLIPQN